MGATLLGVTEPQEQLQKRLSRLRHPWSGLTVDQVSPINLEGFFVVLRVCTCRLVIEEPKLMMTIYGAVETMEAGNHYHYLEVPKDLWAAISEERGWSQRDYTVEAFMARWGVLTAT